jgi:hypothetical protein
VALSRKSLERLLELAAAGATIMSSDPVAYNLDMLSIKRARKALLPEERKPKTGKGRRNKGLGGEREARDYLKEQGFPEATRGLGQSRGGGKEQADCVQVGDLHVEVKRVEKLNIHAALAQAERDAREATLGRIPIVLHRRNKDGWKVTLLADDFFSIYRDCQRIAGERKD